MLGFVKLDFPLDLDDFSVPSEEQAVESWFQQIERKMASWEITEDRDKIAVGARNLTGYVKEAATGKSWGSYDDFKRWVHRVVDLDVTNTDVEEELINTVQSRSFREYEQKYRAIYKKNRQCLYPASEHTVMSHFVRNMRNKHLQRLASSQVFTSFDSLVEYAKDKIRSGQVKELYPSEYPEEPEAESKTEPRTLEPRTLEARTLEARMLEPKTLQHKTVQQKTSQPKTSQQKTSESKALPSKAPRLLSTGRVRDHYSPKADLFQDMKSKFYTAREFSDDEDLIVGNRNHSGERDFSGDGVYLDGRDAGRNSTGRDSGRDAIGRATPDVRDTLAGRESPDVRNSPDVRISPDERIFRSENRASPNDDTGDTPDYDEADYDWRKRMSPVLVDHPLDMYTFKHASEVDGVKEWLKVLSESIFMLDFRTHKEEVTFCIFNARGFVAEAARRHGKFSSFVELKKWVQDIYGIQDQKRDVVGRMIRSTQGSCLRNHIFSFRKFALENEYCKFPVSIELISEMFVQNLRDFELRSVLEPYLYQEEPADLQMLTEIAEDMLASGEIPNNHMDWESKDPPFNNGPPPPGTVERRRRNFVNKSTKRTHTVAANPRELRQRNVRSKTDSSSPGELSTGKLELASLSRIPAFGRSRDSSADIGIRGPGYLAVNSDWSDRE